MSAVLWFNLVGGLICGFIIRLAVESIIEEMDRRKGFSWPAVRSYERHRKLHEEFNQKGVVTLSDDDTWDLLEECKFHIIPQEKFEELKESGGSALF